MNTGYFSRIAIIIFCVVVLTNFSFAQKNKSKPNDFTQKSIESIGILTSTNLYLGYTTLNLVKEQMEKDTSTSNFENMISVTETVQQLTEHNFKKYKELKNYEEIKITNKNLAASIENVYTQLIDDASLLKKYLSSKNIDDYKAFTARHFKLYDDLNKMFEHAAPKKKNK